MRSQIFNLLLLWLCFVNLKSAGCKLPDGLSSTILIDHGLIHGLVTCPADPIKSNVWLESVLHLRLIWLLWAAALSPHLVQDALHQFVMRIIVIIVFLFRGLLAASIIIQVINDGLDEKIVSCAFLRW